MNDPLVFVRDESRSLDVHLLSDSPIFSAIMGCHAHYNPFYDTHWKNNNTNIVTEEYVVYQSKLLPGSNILSAEFR